MRIIIDADASPVRDLAAEIAKKADIPCVFVCDFNHVIHSDYASVVCVDKGNDSADFKILSMLQKGDLVITQDYGLASLCLARGAFCMHQSGRLYTEENIDKLLFERFLSAKIRRSGGKMKPMKKRTKEEDELFRTALINWIAKVI